MKKIFYLIIFCAIYSCNNTTNNSTPSDTKNTKPDSFFNCKIDGKPWSASEISGGFSFGTLVLNGLNTNDFITLPIDSLNYTTNKIINLETKNFAGVNLQLVGYNTINPNELFNATSGEIKITNATKDIAEGTFKFSATNLNKTISITNGEFKVTLNNK